MSLWATRLASTGAIGTVVTDARGQLHRDLIPLPPLPLDHDGGYVEVALGDVRSGTTSVDGVLALLRQRLGRVRVTDDEVLRIRELIDREYRVEGDLRREVGIAIKRPASTRVRPSASKAMLI